jgi:signal peptidase I
MNKELILQIATWMSWLVGPVTLVGMIDDWFLRPRRRIAALPAAASDPPLMKLVYNLIPVLAVGTVVRIVLSERMDFSLVLVSVIAAAAIVWLVDRLWLAPGRQRLAAARGVDLASVPLPVTVDYAHSFLPVFLIVLVVRSFLFEPFRIPSDSMMPTLQDGDLIAVNKFAYGMRLPVLNTRFLSIGAPQRGDVVVFRYPPDPAVNYINGQAINFEEQGRYNDGCYANMRIATEQLGTHRHRALSCRTPGSLGAGPLPGCKRWSDHSYQCGELEDAAIADSNDYAEVVVPPDSYLMMGDNRDNSSDGRYWGFVPEANLVGRASRIWFNWSTGGPVWSRIGSKIE